MISVVIPVYNASETIVRALDSVRNQQGSFDFEIIITDDGSADDGAKVIEEYRRNHPEMNIQVLQQENLGVSAARNAGLRKSTGEFIALLDADDEWLPEKTQVQMGFFAREEIEVDFLTSLWNDEKISFPYAADPTTGLCPITLRKLLFKITGQTSTAIFKRNLLQIVGFFDENQRYAEDANFWMRAACQSRMYLVPRRLVNAGGGKKGFGASGLSANLPAMEKGIQKNIREMYSQKRLNFFEYLFYFVFSKIKYWVRPLRARL